MMSQFSLRYYWPTTLPQNRRPVPIPGDFFTLEADAAIVAIGNDPNPLIGRTTPALKRTSWGGIIVDEKTCATSIPGVYAGGDIVTGAATVIQAMGAARRAAPTSRSFKARRRRSSSDRRARKSGPTATAA